MWNYVDRQQKFKTYDHYINKFEMIWCREVKSTQNHSFKERYLGKFKFTRNKTDAYFEGRGYIYILGLSSAKRSILPILII